MEHYKRERKTRQDFPVCYELHKRRKKSKRKSENDEWNLEFQRSKTMAMKILILVLKGVTLKSLKLNESSFQYFDYIHQISVFFSSVPRNLIFSCSVYYGWVELMKQFVIMISLNGKKSGESSLIRRWGFKCHCFKWLSFRRRESSQILFNHLKKVVVRLLSYNRALDKWRWLRAQNVFLVVDIERTWSSIKTTIKFNRLGDASTICSFCIL